MFEQQQHMKSHTDDIILDDDDDDEPMNMQHDAIDSKFHIPLIPSTTDPSTDVILLDDD